MQRIIIMVLAPLLEFEHELNLFWFQRPPQLPLRTARGQGTKVKMQGNERNELRALLEKPGRYTDHDIETLRRTSHILAIGGDSYIGIATLRASVELIDAIRRFDRTSADLVRTTNTLTRRILWITVGAIFVGVVQLAVAVISFFSSR